MCSRGASSVDMDCSDAFSALTTAPATCVLKRCSDMIFSSRVPLEMRRKTDTDLFWPSRWARSIACRSRSQEVSRKCLGTVHRLRVHAQ